MRKEACCAKQQMKMSCTDGLVLFMASKLGNETVQIMCQPERPCAQIQLLKMCQRHHGLKSTQGSRAMYKLAYLVTQGLAIGGIQISASQCALMLWVQLLEAVQRHDGLFAHQVL